MTRSLITARELTDAILTRRDRMIAAGVAKDYASINAGFCTLFASYISSDLGCDGSDKQGLDELGIDNFMTPDADDDEGRPLDRDLLKTYWPEVVPPDGLTWDDLDRISKHFGWDGGTHIWMCRARLHYDAECPDGTPNLFGLPFFQRLFVVYRNETTSPHERNLQHGADSDVR